MSQADQSSSDRFLSSFDLHLFGEGTHYRIYEHLGAHLSQRESNPGVNFAVWAPNARKVSVIGDFNRWSGESHQMQQIDESGCWELFVPGIGVNNHYKYRIKSAGGKNVDKSDPYGFFAEVPPSSASIVVDLDEYEWSDNEWLAERAARIPIDHPISVYELHLGSWRQESKYENGWIPYREIAPQIVDYCNRMGFTHIELMPIAEHPYTGSWGYQNVGHYSVTSRYGNPSDFMFFVDHCHQNGIGVIIDWVSAHFPKDAHGLAKFDGTSLYEHSDIRQGEHPDWDTLIFNYGRNEVSNYLIGNALFWLDKYHIDGLRVDAVASMLYLDYSREEGEWIPNKYGGRENLEAIDFLKHFNERTHLEFPGVLTIAEESTAWGGVSRPTHSGGLGFSLKWNMGWMNDTLSYMQQQPIHRKYHHDQLTFSLIYAFSENFMLPLSHDEVVHGKGSLLDQMSGDTWQKFANLRLLFSYMWTHPGKKLLFMGSEFGQWTEWKCDSSLQWELVQWESHLGIQKLVADLNRLYREQPSLNEIDFSADGFEWIDCHNPDDSILAYVRYAKDRDEFAVVVCNFTPVVRRGYRVGVPKEGKYTEIFNSDSEYYNGSNVGNCGSSQSDDFPAQGRSNSIEINLPPLGVTIFKLE